MIWLPPPWSSAGLGFRTGVEPLVPTGVTPRREVSPSPLDLDRSSLRQDLEQLLDVLVQEAHTPVGCGFADALGVPGPVEAIGGLRAVLGPSYPAGPGRVARVAKGNRLLPLLHPGRILELVPHRVAPNGSLLSGPADPDGPGRGHLVTEQEERPPRVEVHEDPHGIRRDLEHLIRLQESLDPV